jgi:hypothetical protein
VKEKLLIFISMKKELALIFGEILNPLGFKKKGDYWIKEANEVNTIINLQKSKYGDSFYVNYGYIIKSLPLDGHTAHVFKGIGSINEIENTKLIELLNFEKSLPKDLRITEIKKHLTPIFYKINSVNTENDLLNYLKDQSNLNDVTLTVKRYFGI